MDLDESIFFDRLFNLCHSPFLRQRLSSKGKILIDGSGDRRVIDIISRELKNFE